ACELSDEPAERNEEDDVESHLQNRGVGHQSAHAAGVEAEDVGDELERPQLYGCAGDLIGRRNWQQSVRPQGHRVDGGGQPDEGVPEGQSASATVADRDERHEGEDGEAAADEDSDECGNDERAHSRNSTFPPRSARTCRCSSSEAGAQLMPTGWPPSTTRAWPTANPPRSEHSHRAAEAISSGRPMRPTGSWAMTRARPSGVPPEKRPIIGVSMMPGQIALMRIPSA